MSSNDRVYTSSIRGLAVHVSIRSQLTMAGVDAHLTMPQLQTQICHKFICCRIGLLVAIVQKIPIVESTIL